MGKGNMRAELAIILGTEREVIAAEVRAFKSFTAHTPEHQIFNVEYTLEVGFDSYEMEEFLQGLDEIESQELSVSWGCVWLRDGSWINRLYDEASNSERWAWNAKPEIPTYLKA